MSPDIPASAPHSDGILPATLGLERAGAVEGTTANAVAPDQADARARPRLSFLDNLRAVVIGLVIVLHASITYMLYAPAWWYVLDPQQSVIFTMVVLVVDVPIMPALFFVAGYLALPSLERRGSAGFVREKIVHIAAPWVLGVILFAPLVTYMTEVSRHVPISYPDFVAREFLGPMYEQSVYWFLGVLFIAFLLLAWAWEADPVLRASRPRIEQPRTRLMVAFILATAAGSAAVAPWFGLDDWKPLLLIVIQPARVAFYAGYFALGIYAERRGWFRPDGFRPHPWAWGWGSVVLGIAYLAYRMGGTPTTIPERAAASLLFSAFCFMAVVAGVAVFQRAFNGNGAAWRTIAASSYGIYYVHPLLLFPLAYLLLDLAAPAGIKAPLLVVATFAGSLAVAALVLRRVPGLRRMF